jgi:hypothetical protein
MIALRRGRAARPTTALSVYRAGEYARAVAFEIRFCPEPDAVRRAVSLLAVAVLLSIAVSPGTAQAKPCSASLAVSASSRTPCALAFAFTNRAFAALGALGRFPKHLTVPYAGRRYRFTQTKCFMSQDLRYGRVTYTAAGGLWVIQGWRLPHDTGTSVEQIAEPCGATGRVICGNLHAESPSTALFAYRILPTGAWPSCAEARQTVAAFFDAELGAASGCDSPDRTPCTITVASGSFTCRVRPASFAGLCDNGAGLAVSWVHEERDLTFALRSPSGVGFDGAADAKAAPLTAAARRCGDVVHDGWRAHTCRA